jgi:hypothetical protein
MITYTNNLQQVRIGFTGLINFALLIIFNFQRWKNVISTGNFYLFIISMTKLDTYFSMSTSYSLAKAQSCQIFNQNLVLLSAFSFSSFVKAKFGAFVRILI